MVSAQARVQPQLQVMNTHRRYRNKYSWARRTGRRNRSPGEKFTYVVRNSTLFADV